jgi:hypothetical protein
MRVPVKMQKSNYLAAAGISALLLPITNELRGRLMALNDTHKKQYVGSSLTFA